MHSQKVFDRYRKAIITGGGVIVFILAGLVTMLLTENNTPNVQPSRPKTSEQKPSSPPQNLPPASQPASAKKAAPIYAYITGEVKAPGVYKLSDDARIFQLVDMAGGFSPKADRESLNLAEFVTDGLHIHIGKKIQEGQSPLIPGIPAPPARIANASTTRVSTTTSSARIININTATASELETLPGIGPAISKRIVDYRNAHGNFARPDDIVNVRGIGQSKLAQILPHITVSGAGTRVIQPSGENSSAGKIDINRANSQELQRLKGVGKVTAQRIIDYRNTHGRFNSLDDLINIRGISRAKLDGMRDQIIIR